MIFHQGFSSFESNGDLHKKKRRQSIVLLLIFILFFIILLIDSQYVPPVNYFISKIISNRTLLDQFNDTHIESNLVNENRKTKIPDEPLLTPDEMNTLSKKDQQKLMNKRIGERFLRDLEIQNNGNLFEKIQNEITKEASAKYDNPNWFKQGYNKLSDFAQYSPNKCPLCSFPTRNVNSDSTPKDAVIVSMLNKTFGFVPFVRSLRTTGCQASIVVFINDIAKQKLDESMQQFSESCGVTFINIGSINLDRNHFLLIRNPLIYDFLKLRPNLFDRILVVDVFDTIFQGDPFYVEFDRNSVGFSSEHDRCNRGTIRNAGYMIPNSGMFFKRICINIGTMVGTSSNMLYFLHYHIKYLNSIDPVVMNKLDWIPDQVIFNVMINTNYTIENKIPLRIYRNDEQYSVITSIFKWTNITWDLGNFRPLPTGSYPLVVHLYDRNKPMCNTVLTKCPQTFNTIDNYSRCGFIFK